MKAKITCSPNLPWTACKSCVKFSINTVLSGSIPAPLLPALEESTWLGTGGRSPQVRNLKRESKRMNNNKCLHSHHPEIITSPFFLFFFFFFKKLTHWGVSEIPLTSPRSAMPSCTPQRPPGCGASVCPFIHSRPFTWILRKRYCFSVFSNVHKYHQICILYVHVLYHGALSMLRCMDVLSITAFY